MYMAKDGYIKDAITRTVEGGRRMLSSMIMILDIIFILFALFCLFYSWLDIRREEAEYREFKQKMDEEMEKILMELAEELKVQEDDEE